MPEYISTAEAAHYIGIHPQSLRRWRQDGDARHEGLVTRLDGRAIVYERASVVAHVQNNAKAA